MYVSPLVVYSVHRYEILLIIRLADIEIYIITDTDNWSDVYTYQNSTYMAKLSI